MALRLITPPASEPVTLEDLKLHCRIDSNDEDANLAVYLAAARTLIERETGRAMMPQTWKLSLIGQPYNLVFMPWPRVFAMRSANYVMANQHFMMAGQSPDLIQLPIAPVRSVTSITYMSSSTAQSVVMDPSLYRLDSANEPGTVRPAYGKVWPVVREGPDAFTVTFSAGYDDAASVPAPLRNAVMLLSAHLFENRVPVTNGATAQNVPWTVERLCDPYRVELFR